MQKCYFVLQYQNSRFITFEQQDLMFIFNSRNSEVHKKWRRGLNVLTPTQSLENYQLNTALIEESMH